MEDAEGREREALYQRAERLGASLAGIGDALRSAVDDVNAAAGAAAGDPDAPLSKAVRILNNQLGTLAAADEKIDELEARLAAIQQQPTNGIH